VCKYWSVRDNLKKKETRRKEEEENDKQTNKPNTHPFCAFLLSLSVLSVSPFLSVFAFFGPIFFFFWGVPILCGSSLLSSPSADERRRKIAPQ
jgi:hypothetical protein